MVYTTKTHIVKFGMVDDCFDHIIPKQKKSEHVFVYEGMVYSIHDPQEFVVMIRNLLHLISRHVTIIVLVHMN